MARAQAEAAFLASYAHLGHGRESVSQAFDNSIELCRNSGLSTSRAFETHHEPGLLHELYRKPYIDLLKSEDKNDQELVGLLEDAFREPRHSHQVAAEVLREAAWLAAGQHGFAALAGLPELQQIIAYTCLPVLRKYACEVQQGPNNERQRLAYAKKQLKDINIGSQSLLDSLAPQLRVCLLAEVAAGLLCPGQPLPPDTLEHAAALLAFIDEAGVKVHQEAVRCQFGRQGYSIHRGTGDPDNLKSALAKLQSESDTTDTPLAPHVDLQLQPPPHVLLELFLLACCDSDGSDRTALQQRYQLDDVQMDGLAFLFKQGDQSLLWMHQIAKDMQEVTASSSTNQEAASINSSYTDVQGSSERPELPAQRLWQTFAHMIGRSCNPKVKQLMEQLPPAADSSSFASNLLQVLACEADSTNSVEDLAKLLRKLGGALVLQFLREAHAAGGTAWQQEVPLQVLVLLAAVEQLQGLVVAGVQQQDLQDSSSSCCAAGWPDSLTAAGSIVDDEAAAAADCNAANAVVDCCSVGNGHVPPNGPQLLAKITVCTDDSSNDEDEGEGVAAAQHNPGSQVQQQQQQQHPSNAQQQQQQHKPPQPDLQIVLQKVASIVQLVREFSAANAALDAAGQSASATGVTCGAAGLAPDAMFSTASPLCAQFPEPCGCSIWAPGAAAGSGGSSSSMDAPAADGEQDAAAEAADVVPWRDQQSVVALAGAGVLAMQLSRVICNLCECASSDAGELVEATLHNVRQETRNWLQHTNLPLVKQVQQVCQELGLDFLARSELMQLLSIVPNAVLELVMALGDNLLDQFGLSGSDMLLDGVAKEEPHVAAAMQDRERLEAIQKGREALLRLHKHCVTEVAEPLRLWTEQQQQCWRAALKQLTSPSSSNAGTSSKYSGCQLCRQEQQQQEQQLHGSAAIGRNSNSGTLHTSEPVPYHDPFLWRRLLWQLLGRLKPSAQQWYAQEMNMCPHSEHVDYWFFIVESLKAHLWASPDYGGLERSLLTCGSLMHQELELPKKRAFFVKHYARVVNTAFCKSYDSPAAALLSQQVLLALSPLHLAEVPAQETAALCPSSFGPLVGKLLMQQLGLGQVLQDFSHKDVGQPSMWHAWWHIGIRRYHWAKQQQQAAGPSSAATTSSSSSCAAAGLWRFSPAELEALYQDPDARYYAVGFAARQVHADTSNATDGNRLVHAIKQLTGVLVKVTQQVRCEMLQKACQGYSCCPPGRAAAELVRRCQDREMIASTLATYMQCQLQQRSPMLADLYQQMMRDEAWRTHLISVQHSGMGGVEQLCRHLLNCHDSGSVSRAALQLAPSPAAIWAHPSSWCDHRARLTDDWMCSQCTAVMAAGVDKSYQAEEGQSACNQLRVCDSCCAFYFCSPKCAAECMTWHQPLCHTLTQARQRYNSSCSNNSCSIMSNSRISSTYQWQVLKLLQAAAGPLHEAGPLGVNCLGLLQSRHRPQQLLLDCPMLIQQARLRSAAERPGIKVYTRLRGSVTGSSDSDRDDDDDDDEEEEEEAEMYCQLAAQLNLTMAGRGSGDDELFSDESDWSGVLD